MKEKACLLMLYYITKLIVKHLKIYESSTVHSIEKKSTEFLKNIFQQIVFGNSETISGVTYISSEDLKAFLIIFLNF